MSIVELTKTTAVNLHELLMQLAAHIESLETENADLKRKLELNNDDLK